MRSANNTFSQKKNTEQTVESKNNTCLEHCMDNYVNWSQGKWSALIMKVVMSDQEHWEQKISFQKLSENKNLMYE